MVGADNLKKNMDDHMQAQEKPVIYNVGDKPGEAIYECVFCNRMIRLNNDDEKLSVCRYCDKGEKTKYIKIELRV